MRKTNNWSLTAWILAVALICTVAMLYPRWKMSGSNATISWDAYGYYLYLPAKFIYKDLRQMPFIDKIEKEYAPSGSSFFQAYKSPTGNYVMKYPIGLSLMLMPFFFLAHFLAPTLGYPADGFSLPYQFAVHWGSILVGFVGLWFLRKILLRYFSDITVAWVLIAISFATNYLCYTAIDGIYTHNFLFTILTILIHFTILFYEKPSYFNATIIGFLCGLATITRPTDIIFVLVPLLWGIDSFYAFFQRISLWGKHFSKILVSILIAAAVISIQLLYWKKMSGNWLEYSYQEQGFSWNKPHIKDVLLSYRKGWLVYTPLMILSILGLFFLIKKAKISFLLVFTLFLLHFYIVAAWDIWWYGGGYGQRAMVDIYPILAFPIAAIFSEKFWKNALLGCFVLACSGYNLLQTYQCHTPKGGLDTELITKPYFWKIFGKTEVPDLHKKLLDTKEAFFDAPKNLKTLYSNSFEDNIDSILVDTINVHSGKKSIFLRNLEQLSPNFEIKTSDKNAKWARAGAWFYSPRKEWFYWTMPKLFIRFLKNGQVVKAGDIRFHRQLEEGKWQFISIEATLPKEDFDTIQAQVMNANSNGIITYMDDLVIEVFDE